MAVLLSFRNYCICQRRHTHTHTDKTILLHIYGQRLKHLFFLSAHQDTRNRHASGRMMDSSLIATAKVRCTRMQQSKNHDVSQRAYLPDSREPTSFRERLIPFVPRQAAKNAAKNARHHNNMRILLLMHRPSSFNVMHFPTFFHPTMGE